MSALWSSLISAGAGLLGAVLGAVIGVIGALRASRQASQQASQIAIEQVRFAVRFERKAQAMSTAYDKVGITRDKLAFLPYTTYGYNEQDTMHRSFEAYWESSVDAKAYLDRNAVWIDPGVDQELRDVLRQCTQLANEFSKVLEKGPSSTELETGRKVLEERIKGESTLGSVNANLERIGHMLQGKLELEKPG